ncbi:hypothetical protein [Anaerospora hongkongensis]|uniref:hypothetical protein n=1 Tax=Anaerospora hongkongensis TaxID=244830 RepID=UPI00289E5576|nr:hypothetical protein [Anaerospora hongkongensis]
MSLYLCQGIFWQRSQGEPLENKTSYYQKLIAANGFGYLAYGNVTGPNCCSNMLIAEESDGNRWYTISISQ